MNLLKNNIKNMINLLPQNQKNELFLKKTSRLIMVLGITFLIFLVCLVLILFSLKFYILIDVFIQKEQETSQKDFSELNKIKKEIEDYNAKIYNFKSFYDKQIYFSKMLESIFKIDIPKGVYIIYLSSEKKGDKIESTIYGYSDLRENLILFKNNIEKEKNIINPYFSPDSWTKVDKINFYLSFQYEY
jgi:Tfp pilus assembly protein PilN